MNNVVVQGVEEQADVVSEIVVLDDGAECAVGGSE